MEENLIDGLLRQMNRVRQIIKEYEDPIMKGAGMFAAALMKGDIKNVIKMMVAYTDLSEYKL